MLLNANGNTIGKFKLPVIQMLRVTGTGEFQCNQLITQYAGQTVTLVFGATTSSSWVSSSFFVDDVNVSAS